MVTFGSLRGCVVQIGFVALAWLVMIYTMQNSLIYHPQRYVAPIRDEWPLELHFRTLDGEQAAILYRSRAQKTRRLYLTFGGNAMSGRDWLAIFSDFQDQRGMDDVSFVFVDYPGYGYSDGSPSVESIVRAGRRALAEAKAALAQTGSELVSVGAIGHSIGCAAALAVATEENDLQHLALSAPFTSLADMAGEFFPPLRLLPSRLITTMISKQAWDNRVAARKLLAPVTPKIDIIHGLRDSIVPFAMGKDLSALLSTLNFTVSFESVDAGHNDLLGTSAYEAWLQRILLRD